jgi:hypothetical protein
MGLVRCFSNVSNMASWEAGGPHRRSISSKIESRFVLPCSRSRCSHTHSTRWSLKTPLMSW